MRIPFLFFLIVVSSVALLAADKFTPLNAKEGLWETTITHSGSGMPGIPADALAKMPPEQRAQVEAMMKQKGLGGSGPQVVKSCVTKEKLEKHLAFAESRENCKRTVVSSTPSRFEMKLHCEENKAISDGTFIAEITGGDSAKGSTHMVVNSEGRTMNMDLTFTSRYLGPACGDVK
jgi:hypothetical protein